MSCICGNIKVDFNLESVAMKKSFICLFLVLNGLNVHADTVDLELFETLSLIIKNKQSVLLQDESSLKIILQYSQPQRKIQTNSELSESSLSAE